MCLVWLNRSGVDATFYDAVEFDPMLTVTIGRNRPFPASRRGKIAARFVESLSQVPSM